MARELATNFRKPCWQNPGRREAPSGPNCALLVQVQPLKPTDAVRGGWEMAPVNAEHTLALALRFGGSRIARLAAQQVSMCRQQR